MVTRVNLKVEEVFGTMPELESERLVMRAMTPADAEDMHRYTGDPEMLLHLPLMQTYSVADAEKAIRGFMEMYAAKRCAPWGITLKATGQHIGICGFESWNSQTDRAEIGFIVAREHWRKGYAMESARRVARFGFEGMNLNRLEGRTKPENEGAQLLLEKMGMQCEGLLRQHSYWKGKYHDLQLWAVLKGEFIG